MSYFENTNIDEEKRRNLAFQVLVANRDLLELATKRHQPPTYENSIGLLNEIAPSVYKDFVKLLSRKNDSELVQFYTELAEIKSIELQKEVTPIQLVEEQIEVYKKLTQQDSSKRVVKKRLMEHMVARERMEPVRLTENRILNRDYNSNRTTYAEQFFANDHYTDFKLKGGDILRIRFLHPDNDEHITGADLIYEQYDVRKNQVRFVFLQYKMWEDNVIYKSQTKNLIPQLQKIESMLCKNKLCHSSQGIKTSNSYRFPYCSGFLRPTDRVQNSDSKLVSSGYHLPVCDAIKILESDGKIDKKEIKEKAFKSNVFEELFNNNFVGSRWIEIEKLEELYKANDIFKSSDRIRLYAQEIIE